MRHVSTVRELQRHKRIVNASTKLFLMHGYAATTMDAIAKRAGITKQTLYTYFSTKDMLFQHMILSLCEHYSSPGAVPIKAGDVEQQLYAIGITLAELIIKSDVLAATRLAIAESKRHPKLSQLYYDSGTRRIMKSLAAFLDAQNSFGKLSIHNTQSAASFFFATLKGHYYVRLLLRIKPDPAPQEIQQHVRETVAIFMRVYGGDAPLRTSSSL